MGDLVIGPEAVLALAVAYVIGVIIFEIWYYRRRKRTMQLWDSTFLRLERNEEILKKKTEMLNRMMHEVDQEHEKYLRVNSELNALILTRTINTQEK